MSVNTVFSSESLDQSDVMGSSFADVGIKAQDTFDVLTTDRAREVVEMRSVVAQRMDGNLLKSGDATVSNFSHIMESNGIMNGEINDSLEVNDVLPLEPDQGDEGNQSIISQEAGQTLTTGNRVSKDRSGLVEDFIQKVLKENPHLFDGIEGVSTPAVSRILKAMNVHIAYNTATRELLLEGLPKDLISEEKQVEALPILIRDLYAARRKKASKNAIIDCLDLIANTNRFNPVWDMFINTDYDGEDRLCCLYDILGISENTFDSVEVCKRKERYRLYLIKWLHQCVAMAFNDAHEPYQADGVLVLQGKQGLGKTFFVRRLGVDSEWFCEGKTVDMKKKDTRIQATGRWITELGELDSTLNHSQSSLKAFLTAARDNYRAAYAKAAVNMPRRTSFCATVNPDQFLLDETGSRRFWVIHVDDIDMNALLALSREWLYQMWAQVYRTLYLPDPQGFRLTQEERNQLEEDNQEFYRPIPGEIEIMDKLCWDLPVEDWSYYLVSDLSKIIGGANSIQTGKLLSKLHEHDDRIQVKTTHNKKKYLLPPVYRKEAEHDALIQGNRITAMVS